MKTWEITAIGVTGFIVQVMLYAIATGVVGLLVDL